MAFLLLPARLSGQAVVRDAMASFPTDTQQLAYMNLAQFRGMADYPLIRRYLLTREYADKAGGYAIQGHAGAFIEHLSGSYSGVMGLPLCETVQLLQHFDYPTP